MSAGTTRLNLTKPGGGSTGLITPPDPVDIDVLNANFDKIDAVIGAQKVTSVTRPATPFDGQIIWETDTKRIRVWNVTSGQWEAGNTARGSLTAYLVNTLADLDTITDAVPGDSAYMLTPGTGVNPFSWVAFSGAGATIDWRPDETLVVDTKANLDTFIAAVVAVASADLRFEIGGMAVVTGSRVIYQFTTAVGVYMPTTHTVRVLPSAPSAGVTVGANGIVTSTAQTVATITCFTDDFDDYEIEYDISTSTAQGLQLQLHTAGVSIVGTAYDNYRTHALNSVSTTIPTVGTSAILLSSGQAGVNFRHRGRIRIRNARAASVAFFEAQEVMAAVPGVSTTGAQIRVDGEVAKAALVDGVTFFLGGAGNITVNEIIVSAVVK